MHLTEFDIASLLDGTLTQDQQNAMEAHLAACPQCAEEVASAYRMLTVVRKTTVPEVDVASLDRALKLSAQKVDPSRTFFRKPVRYAIAAALVLGVGIAGYFKLRQPQGSQFRGEPSVHSIEIISPLNHQVVSARQLQFRWSGIHTALQYRLSVYSDDGLLLWKGETMESMLSTPDSVVFESGKIYLWKIEAILPDGTTRSSELHTFRCSPE